MEVPVEVKESPEGRVIGGCELSNMTVGTQIQFLCKTTMCSKWLIVVSSIYLFTYCVCIHMCACVYHDVHTWWRSENNLWESVFSFRHRDPGRMDHQAWQNVSLSPELPT